MAQAVKQELDCKDCGNKSIVITLDDAPTPCYCPICSSIVESEEDE